VSRVVWPSTAFARGGRCFPTPAPFRVQGSANQRSDAIALPPASNEPRINDRIRAREVLLVDSDGTKLGVKPLTDALQLAREQDLDLVEVAANANPPVCRIMDYGKFRFDAAQRAKESRRKTTQTQIKEMKYRVKIGPGDFETKTRKVIGFLSEGHKVKLTIMFRGRETAHPHLGKRILDDVAHQAESVGKVEAAPKLDGRNMIMVLAPDKRAQQQQQARARHQDSPQPAEGPATTIQPAEGSATTVQPAEGSATTMQPVEDLPTTIEPAANGVAAEHTGDEETPQAQES
jgi:translation initiation factor IF-3